MSNFEACLTHILKSEGGFVDHPMDKGGPTKFGITLQTLADYSGLPLIHKSAIETLTIENASKIYEIRYWNTMNLGRIASKKVCLIVFDQGVNAGPVTAVKMLQEVLNESFNCKLKIDGDLGNKTDAAISTADEALLCRRLIQKAQARYISICVANPDQLVFIKGWLNRTFALWEAVI